MPKIVDKEAKKQEILQAALRVFAEKGVDATKIHEIAEAAGIAKGTIYLYFNNKEEIFQSILKLHSSMMESNITSLLSESNDPEEQLKQLILRSVEDAKHSHPEIILDVWSTMIRNPQQLGLGKELHHFQEIISQLLNDGIQQGVFREMDTMAVAMGILSMLHGFNLLEMAAQDQFPVATVSETMIDVLLSGLKASSTS